MHYWHFYGERWTAKTSHLTMTQNGAYHRLVTWMMTHERPLPLNKRDCYAIAGAKTRHQENAVEFVIREFFTAGQDGWHQATADEILTWWDRSGRACNANQVRGTRARVSDMRARRKVLVDALQAKGIRVPSAIGIKAVRELCAQHSVTVENGDEAVTRNGGSDGVCNGVTKNSRNTAAARDEKDERWAGPLTRAIRAVEELKLPDFDMNNHAFVRLIAAGVEASDFKAAASEAMRRGVKYPWAWALKRVEARMSDSPVKPSERPRSDERHEVGGLVTPEGEKRLAARLADPTVSDPWDFDEPSEAKHQQPNEINHLAAS